MKREYLIIGLVILAVLAGGYAFFQTNGQNNITENKSVDTNKNISQNDSSQVTSSEQRSGSSQVTSSDQGNTPSQDDICPTCGGNGYISYTDENGTLRVNTCPACGGSGYI